MVDAERDLCELELARRAVEMELPTLCICRGLQVLFDTLVEMAGTGEGAR
jgi:gamma-glutamyl-gamma-aminobutyrate hydrolase PuuD